VADELRDLVIRAQAGDLDAYGEIVRRRQRAALGLACSRLRDPHLAQDAVQDAFVQAYRDLDRLRNPDAFAAWLRRIVLKYCDRMTRRRRGVTVPVEAAARAPSERLGPDQVIEKRELRDTVLRLIQELPERQRATVTLHYVDGYSQKQVAEFMEIPLTTVKKRLHAARKAMRARMMYLEED